MEARSRANFINSVAAGKVKVCPNCQAENDAAALCCVSCGETLSTEPEPAKRASAFASVSDEVAAASEENLSKSAPVQRYQEPDSSALAKGLPMWTLEPPQVMVRRKR